MPSTTELAPANPMAHLKDLQRLQREVQEDLRQRCDEVAELRERLQADYQAARARGRTTSTYGEWREQPEHAEPPLPLSGAADHWSHREDDDDYYSQPGALFRLMTPAQQEALFGNTARAMGDAPREIKVRHIGNCLKADPAYGKGVADALGIPLSEVGG